MLISIKVLFLPTFVQIIFMRLIYSILLITFALQSCAQKVDTAFNYKLSPRFEWLDTNKIENREYYITDSFKTVLTVRNDTILIIPDSLAAIKGLMKVNMQNDKRIYELIDENKRLREMIKQLIRDEPKYAIKRLQ